MPIFSSCFQATRGTSFEHLGAVRHTWNWMKTRSLPNKTGIWQLETESKGATVSILNFARFLTERLIILSAIRMNGLGMGNFCSSTSSTISSVRRAKALSTTYRNIVRILLLWKYIFGFVLYVERSWRHQSLSTDRLHVVDGIFM